MKKALSVLIAMVLVLSVFSCAAYAKNVTGSLTLGDDGNFSPEIAQGDIIKTGTTISSAYLGSTNIKKLTVKVDGNEVAVIDKDNPTVTYTASADLEVSKLPSGILLGKTLELTTYHAHSFDTSTWESDENNHWHPCTASGNSDSCSDAEDAAKDKHSYGSEGEARWTCETCGYVSESRMERYQKIDEVSAAIAGIGDVTGSQEEGQDSDLKARLEEALSMFNGLSDEDKELVEGGDDLEQKADTFASIDNNASAVTNAIKALPEADQITLNDKQSVQAARQAYNGLSDIQKVFVFSTYVEKLEAAEARIAELEKQDAQNNQGNGNNDNGNGNNDNGNNNNTTGNNNTNNNNAANTTTTGSDTIAKTGGSNNTVIYLVIVVVLVAALAALGFFYKKKKASEK